MSSTDEWVDEEPPPPQTGVVRTLTRSGTSRIQVDRSKSWAVRSTKQPRNKPRKSSTVPSGPGDNITSHGGDHFSQPDTLSQEIREIIHQNEVGLTTVRKAKYLPDCERDRLVTNGNIRCALGHTTNEIVSWITQYAPRTFILIVLALQRPSARNKAIAILRDGGFTDTCLPVSDRSLACQNSDHQHEELFRSHAFWTSSASLEFFERQWSLLLQPFMTTDGRIPELDIPDQRILPFLDDEKGRGVASGSFGEVRPARMLQAYQKAIHAVSHL